MKYIRRLSGASIARLGASSAAFIRGICRKSAADDLLALSAQMSFYFVLAMFPFFIVLAALIGTLPFTGLWNDVLAWIILYLPRSAQHTIFHMISHLTAQRESFLSIGVVGTLLASTGGTVSLMASLNVVYNVRETRSYLRRVVFSLLIICALAVLFLCTFGLLTAGKWIGAWVVLHYQPPHWAGWAWRAGRWVLSFLLTAVAIDIIDNTFPSRKLRWRWVTPGMLFTVVLLIIATNALNIYVSRFGNYGRTYGVLGVFIILMVWIYISSFIILLGAEINCWAGRVEWL